MSENKNLTQKMRAEATLKEMMLDLKKLNKEINFREYIGYELCLNKFKERYKTFLTHGKQQPIRHK